MALALDDDARRPKRELTALDSDVGLIVSNLEQRSPFVGHNGNPVCPH